jgi:RNA polymerase sigma factor for flagellar operon FliA
MDELGRSRLWERYMASHDSEIREQLITEYAQLVKLVAGRMNMYLGYNVEYDDLVGYGVFGLIDAIDKFDFGKNVKFETYASLRIRGAILDQIRKMDWIPRSLRQKQKKIDTAMAKIEAETGKVVTDELLAAELGISIDELSEWQGQMKSSNLISLDEYTEAGSEIKMENVHKATCQRQALPLY